MIIPLGINVSWIQHEYLHLPSPRGQRGQEGAHRDEEGAHDHHGALQDHHPRGSELIWKPVGPFGLSGSHAVVSWIWGNITLNLWSSLFRFYRKWNEVLITLRRQDSPGISSWRTVESQSGESRKQSWGRRLTTRPRPFVVGKGRWQRCPGPRSWRAEAGASGQGEPRSRLT